MVDCTTHDSAGKPSHVLLPAGEKTKCGSAKAHRNAEGLTFADHDVCAELAGRLQEGARGRICDHHEHRAHAIGRGARRREVLDAAEEIRVLDQHARGRVVEPRVTLGEPISSGQFDDFDALRPAVRLKDLPVVRV